MAPVFHPTLPTLRTLQKKLSFLLGPAGKSYALLMRCRAWAYSYRKVFFPAVPCVSIGNLAAGGTGKTPITGWFLDWAKKNKKKATVLTRGYRAKPPFYPFPVSPDADPRHAGDEPLMLAQQHPSATVIVDPVRKRGAAHAQRTDQPDFFLLDDGYQHLSIARDVNILLMRPEDFSEEWNKVIPAGIWREDRTALKRASAILVRADEKNFSTMGRLIAKRLGFLDIPVFSFSLQPAGAFADGREEAPKKTGAASPYLLVSGTASPEDVRTTAAEFMGQPPEKHLVFPDHHPYAPEDARKIEALAAAKNLTILTTAKDAQKLAAVMDFPFQTLAVAPCFGRMALEKKNPAAPHEFSERSFPEWWESEAERLRLAAPLAGSD